MRDTVESVCDHSLAYQFISAALTAEVTTSLFGELFGSAESVSSPFDAPEREILSSLSLPNRMDLLKIRRKVSHVGFLSPSHSWFFESHSPHIFPHISLFWSTVNWALRQKSSPHSEHLQWRKCQSNVGDYRIPSIVDVITGREFRGIRSERDLRGLRYPEGKESSNLSESQKGAEECPVHRLFPGRVKEWNDGFFFSFHCTYHLPLFRMITCHG